MSISPVSPTTLSVPAAAVKKTDRPTEPVSTQSKVEPQPKVETAKINKSYEIENDPPTTVLKFTDAKTKEVVLQIPSQVSINTYKDVQRFIEQQQKNNS